MAKTKKQSFKTGVGVLVYPYLTKPDSYKGKERFKCNIRFPNTDPGAIELKGLMDSALQHQKRIDSLQAGIQEDKVLDYETEYVGYKEEDGFITFISSLNKVGNAGKLDAFEQRPFVYDGQNNVVPEGVKVWTGSKGRLTVELNPWSMEGPKVGISLRLRAAQIIELCDRDDRAAEEWGYTKVEGGYDSRAPVADDDDDVDTTKAEQY